MKLTNVLDRLNSLEKNSFIKIIDNLISEGPVNKKEIDLILTQSDGQLKNVDNENISKVFELVNGSFSDYLNHESVGLTRPQDALRKVVDLRGRFLHRLDGPSKTHDHVVEAFGEDAYLILRAHVDKLA